MAFNNNANQPTMPNVNPPQVQHPAAPIYTVYSGSVPVHGQINHGFHPNHPQTPPPKYEDVMKEPYGMYQQPQPSEVILVAPHYSRTQRLFGVLFMIVFLVAFTSILAKVLHTP